MRLKDFLLLILASVAVSYPAKLLRVPKIYNALITSKEKILPSEAYPATTGPIFQPIGLPGEPILIQPGLIIGKPNQNSYDGAGGSLKVPIEPENSGRKSKPPAPVMFYPRYSVYYAHQPYLTLQQPIVYTAFEVPKPPTHVVNNQHSTPENLEDQERKDLTFQNTKMKLGMTQAPSSIVYVKNNRPAGTNVPDIPPPPLPVRFRNVDEEVAK